MDVAVQTYPLGLAAKALALHALPEHIHHLKMHV